MGKIRLSIDELAVESFEPAGRAGKTGTVRGHESDTETQYFGGGCVSDGVSDCATCAAPNGCPRDTGTCFASCERTNGFGICIEPGC